MDVDFQKRNVMKGGMGEICSASTSRLTVRMGALSSLFLHGLIS